MNNKVHEKNRATSARKEVYHSMKIIQLGMRKAKSPRANKKNKTCTCGKFGHHCTCGG